jgi:hypothetical protein
LPGNAADASAAPRDAVPRDRGNYILRMLQ